MNELDSLFESVRGSAIADVIRDSKIILVTEFDAVHPLKTGEFWFEEESNTLYVGAGQVMGYNHLSMTDFISHKFSMRVIEAPRLKFNNIVPELIITHNFMNKVKIAPKLYFSKKVDETETITHSSSNRYTNKKYYYLHNNININVEHRTEVI